MGFTHLGTFRNIGFKFGKWHNTQWFQLPINEYSINPTPPIKFPEIVNTAEVQEILLEANEELQN
jgi:phosphinothricin acetyltransferase